EAGEMMNLKIKANMRGSQGHAGTVPMSSSMHDDDSSDDSLEDNDEDILEDEDDASKLELSSIHDDDSSDDSLEDNDEDILEDEDDASELELEWSEKSKLEIALCEEKNQYA
ncbi:hypothetical protein Tco_0287036, partial [Tanacetum coccineum]